MMPLSEISAHKLPCMYVCLIKNLICGPNWEDVSLALKKLLADDLPL